MEEYQKVKAIYLTYDTLALFYWTGKFYTLYNSWIRFNWQIIIKLYSNIKSFDFHNFSL